MLHIYCNILNNLYIWGMGVGETYGGNRPQRGFIWVGETAPNAVL
jgi:hypothetical protein